MSSKNEALEFDPSMPLTYSDSWREAYAQGTDTPRLTSYQAPGGEPVVFAYDSIELGGGQNVDTAEYPYGYWSNETIGLKPHTITLKGHLIGEKYIKSRTELADSLIVLTDDDTPGYIDLPLWGRFKVVVVDWKIAEAANENGLCNLSIEFKRAGSSDEKRLKAAAKGLEEVSVESAVEAVKTSALSAFEKALKKGFNLNTLLKALAKITNVLSAIVGRVQGAISFVNGIANKINGITSLIAQGIRSPMTLMKSVSSAVFGVVAGIQDIKNALSETASYFQSFGGGSSSDDGDGSSSASAAGGETEKFVKRNERNAAMSFLTASSFEVEEDAVTVEQWNTKAASENFFKTLAFGAAAQLIVKLNADEYTYENMQGLWTLFEKLEDSIDKEDPDVYAAVENARIACARVLLSQEYDTELIRHIRKEMPLLPLALELGCDADRIRSLNAVADSFLIKGDVVYV